MRLFLDGVAEEQIALVGQEQVNGYFLHTQEEVPIAQLVHQTNPGPLVFAVRVSAHLAPLHH